MNLSQKIKFAENLLYWCGEFEYLDNLESVDIKFNEELKVFQNIQDSEILHLYAYNYNWDDGFDILNAIIDNPNCDVSTALMLFFMGDNSEYLWDKFSIKVDEYNKDWIDFLTKLYNKLLNDKFKSYGISFENPLSKIEKYQLEKNLTDTEKEVFFKNIEGKNLDIYI